VSRLLYNDFQFFHFLDVLSDIRVYFKYLIIRVQSLGGHIKECLPGEK